MVADRRTLRVAGYWWRSTPGVGARDDPAGRQEEIRRRILAGEPTGVSTVKKLEEIPAIE
jgi:hypothetical protein